MINLFGDKVVVILGINSLKVRKLIRVITLTINFVHTYETSNW